MGLGDNRRSPKMRRRVRQAQLKARLKRRRQTKPVARATPATKAPAKGEKKKS